jgi:hypothetical protein
VHPVRAWFTLRGRRNRRLARGVTLAASCKLTVGVLVMRFATLGAGWGLFWATYRLACQADGDHLTGKMEVAPIEGTHSSSILEIPDFKEGLCHLRSPRGVDNPGSATQGDVFTEGALLKCCLHS